MDERDLINRVRAGDGSAERALYDAHVDRVYRLAYRLAGDEALAQDFTQETSRTRSSPRSSPTA